MIPRTPGQLEIELESLLLSVEKPGRYVGGELNAVVKDWAQVPLRLALAFPDVYEIGMPNLGLAILYDQVNQQSDMLAERVFVPWPDMQKGLRAAGLPLYSLESKHAIRDFDVLGVTLPYETLYTNLLALLDLSGVPLLAAERTREDPVVVAGGHATYNPEPVADFCDAFVIGEGENLILEVLRTVGAWKGGTGSRAELLEALARLPGVYVPSLYQVSYHADGTVEAIRPRHDGVPPTVRKHIAARLPPPVTRFLVPTLELVHNRVPIEIMRGCTRGCRFCHAGIIARPVRERSVEEVLAAAEAALEATGYEEVGLLSLSSSDYTQVLELVRAMTERFAGRQVNVSLPSLRIESFSAELMDVLQGQSRRGGFTLAPEAASERMREIINKPVSTEQVVTTARAIYGRGWQTIKLYFMIGHPQEGLDDVRAIAELARAVLNEGRRSLGGRAKVHVGVSTFVPKPHTPFQWVPCDGAEQIAAKQALLRSLLRDRNIKLSWTDARETMIEAWLSRGDRRLGAVILEAYRRGARFDAWREHFKDALWQEAFAAVGLDPAFYTHRERGADEVFPWEHLDPAVTKAFLREDYEWSLVGRTRQDCRDKCFACGILPKFKELRRANPGETWQCPEVGRAAHKAAAQSATEPPPRGAPLEPTA
ncbi:MAG: TIGR03960 family B12-binding radical SAM protein [Deltaproteobacteria bacterium]|nr:TIGR03960 family B12-binding radical SAM protein [Deltaproteobacteria bacterium]